MEFPSDAHLHAYTLDLMMAGANYSAAYSAAMRYLALPRLAALTAPAVFMCRANDPLFAYLDTVEQAERLEKDKAADKVARRAR